MKQINIVGSINFSYMIMEHSSKKSETAWSKFMINFQAKILGFSLKILLRFSKLLLTINISHPMTRELTALYPFIALTGSILPFNNG